SKDFPRRSWLGSGVHEVRLTPTVDAAAAHLVEGPARLEIVATDHSWLAALRRAPRLSRPVTIDLTPPTLEVLSQQHVVRLGGAECAVYRVGADAVTSGITVGETTFPGGDGDLVAGYLRVNRELRVATEKRLRDLCRDSAPEPLWEGAFLRQPGSEPLSGFADHRTYLYRGQPIDHQTHLGFDLASYRGSPVPAGNNGRVVFA